MRPRSGRSPQRAGWVMSGAEMVVAYRFADFELVDLQAVRFVSLHCHDSHYSPWRAEKGHGIDRGLSVLIPSRVNHG